VRRVRSSKVGTRRTATFPRAWPGRGTRRTRILTRYCILVHNDLRSRVGAVAGGPFAGSRGGVCPETVRAGIHTRSRGGGGPCLPGLVNLRAAASWA